MIDINLVPPQLRKKRKSSFSLGGSNIPMEIVVGIGGGFLVILVGIHLLLFLAFITQSAQHQSMKNGWEKIQSSKQAVDQLINEMRALQSKGKAIEDLTGNNRVVWAQKLNIIGDFIPRGIWLRKIVFENGEFSIEGSSISRRNDQMMNIHDFASILKKDSHFPEHFTGIELGSIQRRNINKIEVADFVIETKLK